MRKIRMYKYAITPSMEAIIETPSLLHRAYLCVKFLLQSLKMDCIDLRPVQHPVLKFGWAITEFLIVMYPIPAEHNTINILRIILLNSSIMSTSFIIGEGALYRYCINLLFAAVWYFLFGPSWLPAACMMFRFRALILMILPIRNLPEPIWRKFYHFEQWIDMGTPEQVLRECREISDKADYFLKELHLKIHEEYRELMLRRASIIRNPQVRLCTLLSSTAP